VLEAFKELPSIKVIPFIRLATKGKRGPQFITVDAGGHKSYVMALLANQLVAAYHTLGRDAIFSLNIRNFIGNSGTNRQIYKTATEDSQNFYLFNNGISCLATKVVLTDQSVEIVGLQVINGAQTVKTLVQAANKWSSEPSVLVRITEIQEGYGPGGKIREPITRSNNTQNTIKISDFRSNDSIQDELRSQFSSINRSGRKVAYLPKRTDKIPPQTEIVRMEEFAK
jgi:hypothetical protein